MSKMYRCYDGKHLNMSCAVCEKKVNVRLGHNVRERDTLKRAPHSLSHIRQNWIMSKFHCSREVLCWMRSVSRSLAAFLWGSVRFYAMFVVSSHSVPLLVVQFSFVPCWVLFGSMQFVSSRVVPLLVAQFS